MNKWLVALVMLGNLAGLVTVLLRGDHVFWIVLFAWCMGYSMARLLYEKKPEGSESRPPINEGERQ